MIPGTAHNRELLQPSLQPPPLDPIPLLPPFLLSCLAHWLYRLSEGKALLEVSSTANSRRRGEEKEELNAKSSLTRLSEQTREEGKELRRGRWEKHRPVVGTEVLPHLVRVKIVPDLILADDLRAS
eukprot:751654-Hanusia_phi.AAC.1